MDGTMYIGGQKNDYINYVEYEMKWSSKLFKHLF